MTARYVQSDAVRQVSLACAKPRNTTPPGVCHIAVWPIVGVDRAVALAAAVHTEDGFVEYFVDLRHVLSADLLSAWQVRRTSQAWQASRAL